MTQVPVSCDHLQFVSINKFEKSIERVMDRVWMIVGNRRQTSLFPTLIGIHIDPQCHERHSVLFRAFLDSLGKVQVKHFVRFVVDAHWAMMSDSGFLFYTKDGSKESHCDIVWEIGARSDVQVDIAFKVPVNPPRRDLLDLLSINLKKFIKCDVTDSGRTLFDTLLTFYKNTKGMGDVQHLKENLHVLLLPNEARTGFYPVPIYGMSYFDGSRREGRISQWSGFYRQCYEEFFTHDQDAGQAVYALLDLIRDNAHFGVTQDHVQETYGLAEMVFAFWAMNHDGDESNHDVLLFNVGDRKSRETTVYRYPMGT